jgi:hypothetical protein
MGAVTKRATALADYTTDGTKALTWNYTNTPMLRIHVQDTVTSIDIDVSIEDPTSTPTPGDQVVAIISLEAGAATPSVTWNGGTIKAKFSSAGDAQPTPSGTSSSETKWTGTYDVDVDGSGFFYMTKTVYSDGGATP